MMKRYLFAIPVFVAVLLASCSTDEIEYFDSNDYLSFESTSLSYTFAFSDESVTQHDFSVPVVYAGRYRDRDAQFKVSAVAGKGTAVEGRDYEIIASDGEDVIKAGTNTGNAHIRLLRTDSMKTKTYTVVLAIEANEDFLPGVADTMTVSITDRLVQPDWWTWSPYNRYLGDYTETKLRLWLEFMGVEDGSDPFDQDPYIQWLDYGTGIYNHKSYRDSEVKPKVMEFRDWLLHTKGNPEDPATGRPVSEGLGSF